MKDSIHISIDMHSDRTISVQMHTTISDKTVSQFSFDVAPKQDEDPWDVIGDKLEEHMNGNPVFEIFGT